MLKQVFMLAKVIHPPTVDNFSSVFGSFPKLGVLFEGPNSKHYSILGSILGSPCLGNYHYESA